MRINVQFEGVFISGKETVTADGQRRFHTVSIENNDEAGTFNCTEGVYQAVLSGAVKKYEKYVYDCLYNSDYKSFSVQRILPAKK